MIAADELAPEDDETIVATGFIVRNWYSLNYDQWMRDTVEHLGKAFLGLRVNCALCHDHKYDPISQAEYFQLRAFFEPLEMRQDRTPGGPDLPKLTRYVPGSCGSKRPIAAGLARVYDHDLEAETYMYRGGDVRLRFEGQGPVAPGVPAFLGGDLRIEPVELPPLASYPGLKPWLREELLATARTNLQAAQASLAKASAGGGELAIAAAHARLRASEQQIVAVQARVAADRVKFGGEPGDAQALAQAASGAERLARLAETRAALAEKEQTLAEATTAAQANPTDQALKMAQSKAEKEQQAAAQAVSAAEKLAGEQNDNYTSLAPQYPTRSTGRRTALARWITRDDHPLTPRVAVNHLWMRHFGQPLVEPVFDFGRGGKAPTDQRLLDWLAVELVENGWRMKHLHRLMVTSGVYRLRSETHEAEARNTPAPRANASGELAPKNDALAENLKRDPDNRYLWRFPLRRLESEAVRDSILHVAGELDLTLGGPALDRGQQDTSPRRSMYFEIYPEDGGMIDFNALFDPPDPTDCYRRANSIMPQQALATTNSLLVIRQGRLLARRLWDALPTDPAYRPDASDDARHDLFLVAAFEQVLARPPRPSEMDVCREFLKKQTTLYEQRAAEIAAAKPKRPPPRPPSPRPGPERALSARCSATPILSRCDSETRSTMSHPHVRPAAGSLAPRRKFLADLGLGFTGLALGAMLHRDGITRASALAPPRGAWVPQSAHTHHPARAKSVIWIFLSGGLSHLESFDPKPELNKYAGQTFADTPYQNPYDSPLHEQRSRSVIEMVRERYQKIYPLQVGFKPYGQSGIEVSDWFSKIGECVDDLAVIRSMYTTDNDHAAENQFHTGRHKLDEIQPSIGAWVEYGLASLNENLPQFVALGGPTRSDTRDSIGSYYLGPQHAAVPLKIDPQDPLPFGRRASDILAAEQRNEYELIGRLNQLASVEYPTDEATLARIRSYELAFGMQQAAPEALDFTHETAETRLLYGLDRPETKVAGERCLAARRLIERGVRFVQLYPTAYSAWDSHQKLRANHAIAAERVDTPIAGLMKDLKRRGLLDETIVVFSTEFGRTPAMEERGGGTDGRDHHPHGFTVWMAGAGLKKGIVHGATDELGYHAVEHEHYVTDIHATVLHLLGLDLRRMEIPGRKRLEMDPQVIHEILA